MKPFQNVSSKIILQIFKNIHQMIIKLMNKYIQFLKKPIIFSNNRDSYFF